MLPYAQRSTAILEIYNVGAVGSASIREHLKQGVVVSGVEDVNSGKCTGMDRKEKVSNGGCMKSYSRL